MVRYNHSNNLTSPEPGFCISQVSCCWDPVSNTHNLKGERFNLACGFRDSVHSQLALRQKHHSRMLWWSKDPLWQPEAEQGNCRRGTGKEPQVQQDLGSFLYDALRRTQESASLTARRFLMKLVVWINGHRGRPGRGIRSSDNKIHSAGALQLRPSDF